jgi:cation diffusion facilitator family transporter
MSEVGILGNILLAAFKLLAGILGRSGAMVSDAVHSLSDVFATLIAYVGVKLAGQQEDAQHPYGHERFECVAAIVLSVVLAMTGVTIGIQAIEPQNEILMPGLMAFCAAVLSILVKETMYWYTRYYALKLDSGALMADAWHHRSDALSSIGALIGIAGTSLGYPLCDSIASLIICAFILKASFDIFKDAIDKMIDKRCDDTTEQLIKEVILSHPDVLSIDFFQTRLFGNKIYIDLEISVDAQLTFKQAHDCSENVHTTIEKQFPKVKHIMIHVNPSE